MTILSIEFLAFIAIAVFLYYLFPKRWQWVELLIVSVAFYCLAAVPYTILFLCISTITAYFAGRVILRQSGSGIIVPSSKATLIISLMIVINIALWFILKGSDLWLAIIRPLSTIFPALSNVDGLSITAALGMGYYTLQVIGYILDCYWQTIQPQKNILKLFLFVGFFPQLVTGPISRYEELQSLYEPHKVSYNNLTRGAQRILWGFIKKLVLAERVGIVVNAIWSDLSVYTGVWHWVALLLYPIQLYADFSGCVDIVLGVAELFGIKLPENFNNPFFSRTIKEFWQRWHITLGAWAKNYVMYPFLKMKWMVKLGKKTKKKFGKRIGKLIPTAIGTFALWMVMGIWHGSPKHIIGVSLWYWALMMLSELFSPALKKINETLKIKQSSFSWHLFQSLRTYFLFSIGSAFFRADSVKAAVVFLKSLFSMFFDGSFNPWALFDGTVSEMGISYRDIEFCIIVVILILIVGFLRERYGYARNWMKEQILPFRWLVWIVLFVFVLICGKYGPGYSAAEFIYQGF